MKPNQQVVLTRDCPATTVPGGSPYFLRAGSTVRLTQALGGNYTVMNDTGYILLIDAKDADALGISPEAAAAEATQSPVAEFSEKLVWDELKTVYDPEIPVNVVDLGLIYECQIMPVEGGHKLDVKMTMTAPGCGMGGILKADIERKLSKLPTIQQVNVDVVLDPPWHPGKMSEAARLQLGLDLESSPLPMYGRD
ncbi:MAG TPA: putative Fe-S cluster assembly protein SufT [Verrucomicrobiae bacterium]|jgi:probable FeS assembly SUF system protein SufT|nr:putative Fe-S cluster assembly protein SufT [Verrucomicrobiae bacterium]